MSDELKRQAAIAALRDIDDGMIVGLGTGSTASHFIRELGKLVAEGLRVQGIPTSDQSRKLALEAGVPLTTFKEHAAIDLAVDGADEVSPALDLIKGLGGALVREKIVAHAAKRFVIVIDESKLVPQLGTKAPIPVEVVPFAADVVAIELGKSGGRVQVRQMGDQPFISDNGNMILDWMHGPIADPQSMEWRLKTLTGVVDSGIFAKVANRVIVAASSGIRVLDRSI
jgi:ribose 5-phosphate isomerase A